MLSKTTVKRSGLCRSNREFQLTWCCLLHLPTWTELDLTVSCREFSKITLLPLRTSNYTPSYATYVVLLRYFTLSLVVLSACTNISVPRAYMITAYCLASMIIAQSVHTVSSLAFFFRFDFYCSFQTYLRARPVRRVR